MNESVHNCELLTFERCELRHLALENDDSIIELAAEQKDNVRPFGLYIEINVHGAKDKCEMQRILSKGICGIRSVSVYEFTSREIGEIVKHDSSVEK